MTLSDLEHFRNILLEREQNLSEWLDCIAASGGEDARKARDLLEEIREALEKIEQNRYGICKVCECEVELHRLEVQPATEVCLACISDKDKETLEEELYIASKIHRALLPKDIREIEGFDFAVKSLAAHSIGGDYYDFLRGNNGHSVKVIIADSMGKGMPAGLLVSNLQGALRILAETIESPSGLITRLNQWLCRNIPVTKFISLACVAFEPGDGDRTKLTYTSAGHWPAIIVREDGSVERLDPTGVVLGIGESFSYDESEHALASGDVIVLFTDGVTEAANGSDEMYGEERLVEYIQNHRGDSLDALLTDLVGEVLKFTESSELQDDLTLIALRKR